jgi:filamentous hemagglutinin family protein
MKILPTPLFSFLVFLALLASEAFALPAGTEIVTGQASIARTAAEMRITAGDGAILEHAAFDVAAGETVRFIQPGVDARVLNRILSASPSRIDGSLLANGHVYLVNPAGVLFGAGSVVEVGKLHAIAGRLSDEDFIARRDRFRELSGEVLNEGSIHAGEVVLAGAAVSNLGRIHAPGGLVVLAAGDGLELVASDGSVSVNYEGESAEAPAGAFFAVGDLAGHALLQSGVVEASRVETRAGAFRQDAGASIRAAQSSGDGGSIRVEATSRAEISGTVDASGTTGTGGQVAATADTIVLSHALLDASGEAGGGEILIGGGYQGKDAGLANAQVAIVGEDVELRADALSQGDGGLVVLWSDRYTGFHGKAFARGGPQGGDGGLVETSSKGVLDVTGFADASAPLGEPGTWLLDPNSVLIVAEGEDFNVTTTDATTLTGSGASLLTTSTITTALLAGNSVTVQASGEGSSVSLDKDVTLTLQQGGKTSLTLSLLAETVTIPASASILSEGPSLTLGNWQGAVDVSGSIFSSTAGITLTINAPAAISGNVQYYTMNFGNSLDLSGSLTGAAMNLNAGDPNFPADVTTFGGTINIQDLDVTLWGGSLNLTGIVSATKAALYASPVTQSGGSLTVNELNVQGAWEGAPQGLPSSVSLNSSTNQIGKIAFGNHFDTVTVKNTGSMEIVKYETTSLVGDEISADSFVNKLDVRVSSGDLTVSVPLAPSNAEGATSLLLAAEGNLILNVTPEELNYSTRMLYGTNLNKGESFDANGSLDAFSTLSGASFGLGDLNVTLGVSTVKTLAADNPTFEGFQGGVTPAVSELSDEQFATLIGFGAFSQYSYFLQVAAKEDAVVDDAESAATPASAAEAEQALTETFTDSGGSSAVFGGSFAVVASAGAGASAGGGGTAGSGSDAGGSDGGGDGDGGSGDGGDGGDSGDGDGGDGDGEGDGEGEAGGAAAAAAKAASAIPFAPISRPILSPAAAKILDAALSDEVEIGLQKYLDQ